MIKGVKNRAVRCDLQWHQTLSLKLKKTVGPAPALHKQLH